MLSYGSGLGFINLEDSALECFHKNEVEFWEGLVSVSFLLHIAL
jgi:hypothetical protein